MAKNNSSNQDFTNEADGGNLGGGVTKRFLRWLGANITLTGSGTNIYTFPASSDTLLGRTSTDTVTGKSMSGSSNTFTNIPASALDSSAIGQGFLEIGRTTLGSAGDTITVSSLPARKYLHLRIFTIDSGQTDIVLRFNGDSGNNYAYRISDNGGADSTTTSTGSIRLTAASSNTIKTSIVDIYNIAAQEKIVFSNISRSSNGAANAPGRVEGVGKWANTSNQISSIVVTNLGTGSFDTGSELVVFGKD